MPGNLSLSGGNTSRRTEQAGDTMFPKSRTGSDQPAPMIIPVRPAARPDEDPATSSPAGLLRRTLGHRYPSRRTFGYRFPSRRTFGYRYPSRRTFGINHPSRRTFGRYTPSRRTFGRYTPSRRTFGITHP
jgi:hypothetical protein